MHRLRVLAADRRRAGRVVGPLAAHHQVAVAIAHFRMHEMAFLVGNHHHALEAKRAFEPVERGQRILVEQRGTKRRAAKRVIHDDLLVKHRILML
ncbi:hypothetical protein D3C85_1524140 [compost metagenome]